MSTNIYTRKECVKLIDELEVISYTKTKTVICKKKIPTKLMESILFHTKKCRDNISERIYWILNDIEDYPFCKQCGKQFKPRFYGLSNNYTGGNFCSATCSVSNENTRKRYRETCLEKYGVEHSAQSELVKEKGRQTCQQKYGVDNQFQVKEVQEKSKQTCLLRYGVEYIFQLEEFKEKRIKTCLERYGVEYTVQSNHVKEQIKNTLRINYGIDCPSKSKEIQERAKQTCLEKYGVENPMQNKEVFEKSQKILFKLKELILPSGKIITYQGYENIAIFKLLEDGYLEEQVITETDLIPSFNYIFKDKNKTYFPDIYIPHENKIIEVKSTYTYSTNLEQNLAKRQACLDAGFNFEFWICSDKEVVERL